MSPNRGPELFRNPSRSPARNFACVSSNDAPEELRGKLHLLTYRFLFKSTSLNILLLAIYLCKCISFMHCLKQLPWTSIYLEI